MVKAIISYKSIKKVAGGPISQINIEYFVEHKVKGKLLEKHEDHILVDVLQESFKEQTYNGKTWFLHESKDYGLFLNDNKWIILFQR